MLEGALQDPVHESLLQPLEGALQGVGYRRSAIDQTDLLEALSTRVLPVHQREPFEKDKELFYKNLTSS